MPLYFGATWASLALGSLTLSVLLTALVIIIASMVKMPSLRGLIFQYVIGPLVSSILSLVMVLVTATCLETYLWGNINQYPRRPSDATNKMTFSSMCGVGASLLLGVTRLMKSIFVSILGLLSVTHVGTHENAFIEGPVHGYYLGILRMERFKLEVDRGLISIEVSNDTRCRSLLTACSSCCCLCMVWTISAILFFWLSLLSSGHLQPGF